MTIEFYLPSWPEQPDFYSLNNRAIYTTAWARPTLSLAWAGSRTMHLKLGSGPNLNHKF